MLKRILRFSHGLLMTYESDGQFFGLFSKEEDFDNLSAEQILEVMNEASALIDKIEKTGLIYNEKNFLLAYNRQAQYA